MNLFHLLNRAARRQAEACVVDSGVEQLVTYS